MLWIIYDMIKLRQQSDLMLNFSNTEKRNHHHAFGHKMNISSPKMYSLFPESPDLKTRYSVKDELAQIRFENIQCAFHPRTQCLWSSDVLLGDYLLRLSNTERLLLILQRIYSVGGFCTKTSKKSRMRIYASVRICPWVPLTNPKLYLSGPRCTYCWFTFTFQANSSRRADQHPLQRAWWGNNRHWQV